MNSLKYHIVTILLISGAVNAQDTHAPIKHFPVLVPHIEFIENNGQWDENIQLRSSLPGGDLYFESDKLTYVFYSEEDMATLHKAKHSSLEGNLNDHPIRAHLFQVKFVNGNREAKFNGQKKRSNYYNYFLGNDRRYWAGKVPAYHEVYGTNIWEGIDYKVYSQDIDLKYDFVVHKGADPGLIQLEVNYIDKLQLKNGNLHFTTSVNELIDMKPMAYQKSKSGYDYVPCQYKLKGNVISFTFPKGYDSTRDLVIDPKLIFSTYTGATKDNWGFTATFDESGNLYGGGMVFTHATRTYPTTPGAFQITQGGGTVDIGLTKFNANGTNLIFSTYIGGSGNEIPHSLVVTSKNELVMMGTASSTNYPVTSGAYDTAYNVNGNLNANISYVPYLGSDVVVTKFSPAGNNLVGSTYIGGPGFDGVNRFALEYNYGDDVRGEVVVDGLGNAYVATTTESTGFPVTNGSVHSGGGQDAVIFKLDTSLKNLIWSTYLGGNGLDAAYSVQVDGIGRAYVGGGTTSNNFPTTSGTIHPAAQGGTDGFVTIINSNGIGLSSSTILGTPLYDQVYFVQLDDSGRVYAAGQTRGPYPIFPSTVYSNPFSGQFIHKMNSNLSATVFSTVIGTGGASNIDVDIALSAFLVNQCDHIYLSGWGGSINSTLSQATTSTTNGLPVTPGAHKVTTDGNDFYLIVLDEDADSLLYATFFGGNNAGSGEHVDGGTSRFDKKGIVYQAVCAGCGGNSGFPTAPSNVWSTTNNSTNCNLGVIKFDLAQLTSDIGLNAINKVCIPGTVAFVNNSNGGTNYFWDFGDGDTSNLFAPTHTYVDTGNFTVMLIVSDSLSCMLTDTSYISIRGEAPPVATIDTIPVICPGDSIMLQANGGIKYIWFPKTNISNDTISNPFVKPPINTTYTVHVGDSCGGDTSNYFAWDSAFVDVILAQDLTSASPDDTVCYGTTVPLMAAGGVSYQWFPPTYLSKNNVPNPLATPLNNIMYTIQITDQYGCIWNQNVILTVEDSANPNIGTHPDTVICPGDTIQIWAIGGQTYSWHPGILVSDSLSNQPLAFPSVTTQFLVDIKSKCFFIRDTLLITVDDFQTIAMPDTFACEDMPIKLKAKPGQSFKWTPASLLDDPNSNEPTAILKTKTLFYVEAKDIYGCASIDSVLVNLRPKPYLSAGDDQLINGNSTRLEATGNGKMKWEPEGLVICPTCSSTDVIVMSESVLFAVSITDQYGCKNIDDVLVTRISDGMFVPNSFTPNSDRKNEVWKPIGYNVTDYELSIVNRWGEIIFISKNFEVGWDGTYNGELAEDGVYVWKISYTQNGEQLEKFGTLTMLR